MTEGTTTGGPSVLDEMVARLGKMPDKDKLELKTLLAEKNSDRLWTPTAGPQYDAVKCLADLLLYGGSGGCGKTDLDLGLAFTEHQKSLMIRKTYTDLGGLTDRAIEINGTRDGFNGSIPPKLNTVNGRRIDFGGISNLGDEEHWQGRPHDLLCIDEVVQCHESQVRFLMGWVRSTTPGQRCRTVLSSNPPVNVKGDWIIAMFAPWLDPRHPNPAKPGELRWFATVGGHEEGSRDIEVDLADCFQDGGFWKILIDGENDGKPLRVKSRTFIPGSVDDNPFLRDTGYKAELDSLPEPLRSAIRDGNFMAARQDEADQLIPTDWIRAAQERWEPTPPYGIPMCSMGVDCARAKDETVLAQRHDGWYAPLICVPGSETPHGTDIASLVLKHRRDNALIIVDIGEGTGGQAYAHLKNNLAELDEIHTSVVAYRGIDRSAQRTAEKQLGFIYKRDEAYWRFREALDPGQEGGSPIALPDDPKLVSDLTAVTWELRPQGIKVLPKDKVVEKLQRSPDRGDAVVMAWTGGATAVTHINIWRKDHRVGDFPRHRMPSYDMGARYKNRRR